MDCSLPGSSVHGDSPGKNTGVGCHSLLQRIFPTQGSNSGLPHCRQVLYHLSHQGSVKVNVTQSCLTLCDPMDCSLPDSSVHGIFQAGILEWVAIPFCRGYSRPRDRTQVSWLWADTFTVWATSSVQFSRSVVSDCLRPHESQHARPPCPSPRMKSFFFPKIFYGKSHNLRKLKKGTLASNRFYKSASKKNWVTVSVLYIYLAGRIWLIIGASK